MQVNMIINTYNLIFYHKICDFLKFNKYLEISDMIYDNISKLYFLMFTGE